MTSNIMKELLIRLLNEYNIKYYKMQIIKLKRNYLKILIEINYSMLKNYHSKSS